MRFLKRENWKYEDSLLGEAKLSTIYDNDDERCES